MTEALAVIGAITGVVGLIWQLINYWLAGGRIKILAFRFPADETPNTRMWRVEAFVSNVGRLAVFVTGYAVWIERPRSYRERISRYVAVRRRFGFRLARAAPRYRPTIGARVGGARRR